MADWLKHIVTSSLTITLDTFWCIHNVISDIGVGVLSVDRKILLECRKHDGKPFTSFPAELPHPLPFQSKNGANLYSESGTEKEPYQPEWKDYLKTYSSIFGWNFRKVALRFTFHPEFPRFSVKSPPQSFFPFCLGDEGKRTPDHIYFTESGFLSDWSKNKRSFVALRQLVKQHILLPVLLDTFCHLRLFMTETTR